MTRNILGLALASLILVLPASAAERDHAPKLLELLRGIDSTPNAAELQAVSRDPVAALFGVASDSDLAIYERRRAVSLLSRFPTERSAGLLQTIAVLQVEPKIRGLAIYTYVRGWGTREPKAVMAYCRGALASPVEADREAAARGLRWVDSDAVEPLIAKSLAGETAAPVRKALERARSARAATTK